MTLILIGVLLFLFFASAAAIIFLDPAVTIKESRKQMVPFNDKLKEATTNNQPRRAPDGTCVVCGFDKNGHEWRCIAYFMNLVAEGYKKEIVRVEALLEDIEAGRQVSKLRANIIRKSIEEMKELTKAIKET